MKSAKLLTLRAYAKHRGVNEKSVREAIASQRIKKGIKGRTSSGRYQIDPKVADKEWAKNTSTIKGGDQRPEIKEKRSEGKNFDYYAARAKKEHWEAQLAELRAKEKEGQLVEVDNVKREAFEIGRRCREAMLSIVPRVADRLLAIKDAHEIYQLLESEIKIALQEFSNDDA